VNPRRGEDDAVARTRHRPTLQAAVAGCACLAAAAGCAGSGGSGGGGASGGSETIPAVNVTADATRIVEGGSVRLEASVRGHDADDASIDWISTGGRLTPDRTGRAATAQFDRAGVYTVTARLLIGGDEADRDSETIEVTPGGLAAERDRQSRQATPASAPAPAPARIAPAAPAPQQPSPDAGAPAPQPDNTANDSTKEDPG